MTIHDCLFPADPGSLATIRAFLRDLGESHVVPKTTVDEFLLAVSEAASNAILHGAAGRIRVTWRSLGDRIEVEIVDDGVFRAPPREVPPMRGLGIPSWST